MFLNKSWNHDEAYNDIYNGKPSGIGITIPTLTDPSLALGNSYDTNSLWYSSLLETTESIICQIAYERNVVPGATQSLRILSALRELQLLLFHFCLSAALNNVKPILLPYGKNPEKLGLIKKSENSVDKT
jgi:hypothetical protein